MEVIMKKLNIALIGHKFMGRAHTHAYTDLPIFFNTGIEIVKKVICSNEEEIKDISKRWGWESYSLDWKEVVKNDDVDIVDIAAPSDIHAEIAIAAAKAGKHVFCEKPLALKLSEAKNMMLEAEKAGIVNMIGFNYRRVPALALAKLMIEEGLIGDIFHFRGIYQQSWLVDPKFPLVWRLQKSKAGYGAHGDMGAHVIDLARFLVGDIEEVICDQRTFTKYRPKPVQSNGLKAIAGNDMGIVDVDDASAMILKFKDNYAMGYIEITRNGTGHRNQNLIEVNGSLGALIFDMESMNELKYYNVEDNTKMQGFRIIQVGEEEHPYMNSWWPAGHIIGYGDTLVNQAYDFINAIVSKKKVKPDFKDGYLCQQILEAAQISYQTRRWVKVDDIE
jgi:predicted dehydrogenase